MTRRLAFIMATALWWGGFSPTFLAHAEDNLAQSFANPPATARPWVYWMWMDGNLTREGITADLEAMKSAGIGGVIIMEVNVGIPQGPVKFMGPEWRALFKHVAAEAARLGIEMDLNASPGWTGSGGPWIKPEQSMQKIVFSETGGKGPRLFRGLLPQPPSKEGFYRDVAVLAFPTPTGASQIPDLAEKALYHRGHYSSERGVASSIPIQGSYPAMAPEALVSLKKVVNLTTNLDATGRLLWEVPQGNWTIVRFGRTSTGANTRPAPVPGLGLECDKLDKAALDAHFQEYIGKLLGDIGGLTGKSLVSLHIDSWEMGPQNWTAKFREEFQRLRGYDPLPYLPAMTGRIVESLEISERFLWDLRQTVQDLILENHARHLRTLAHQHGMRLSIEPYDGTPCDDLALGAVADVPMCEFWIHPFDTSFSCIEASSIAHTYGQRVVAAEAFTSSDTERWKAYPGSMKALGDWAFCRGINRFVFHRYQHQPWLNRLPGMTMGPYGVHHERTQTWWELSYAYHAYLARCQFLLQQGLPMADICYLSPEGAPNVFRPPASALRGTPPEHQGYNFDGCTPEALLTRLSVKDGKLTLPDGMSYRVLVLPERASMSPPVLRKLKELVQAGATVVGPQPSKSPSLAGFPECDQEVRRLAAELWAPKGIIPTEAAKPTVSAASSEGQLLSNAKWIWFNEGNPAASAPVGTRYFRRTFVLDVTNAESARISMTADNSFELWLNGQPVGSGDNFNQIYSFDIASFLKPGTNLLTVAAINGSQTPNPAGLIGAVEIKFRNGRTLRLVTDRQWEAAPTASANWTSTPTWPSTLALELGPLGMAPWGKAKQVEPVPEDYVSYAFVSNILQKMGVSPDFESDARLRYTHRRVGDTDIYFVANPEERSVSATCRFRDSSQGGGPANKRPELWDPLTGKVRSLPEFTSQDGRMVIPLRFEPCQSFFIVFRKAAEPSIPTGPNFPNLKVASTLSGSWDVAFDPNWGGPERVTFPALDDWTSRPEEGIRYYSGTAVYRKTFDTPEGWREARSKPIYLDLGTVKNLARVFVNEQDLGVAWCAPWRVNVTSLLKPKGNQVVIRVVNLWPNRLIGDEQLPADCAYHPDGNLARWPEWLDKNQPRPSKGRYTFATWKHFSKNSPLLSSGLLGPVTLQVED